VPDREVEADSRVGVPQAPEPFLVFRDGTGAQVVRRLHADAATITLGRHASCEIALEWDEKVSRTHAVLQRLGNAWTVADEGLSRNGTYVNGERVSARTRLLDGDTVRLGATVLTFREPPDPVPATVNDHIVLRPELTPAQRRVLIALCRPYKARDAFTTPATNAEIAQELVVTIDAVKTQMRALFAAFDVGELPQNQKRVRVVELAFQTGAVKERDL
jgi:pSer/pThr/pTyr-binding forkhead associated (FHA) protein